MTDTDRTSDVVPVNTLKRQAPELSSDPAKKLAKEEEANPGKPENSKRKRLLFKYPHGNYPEYYGYRNLGILGRDPRLSVLSADWFNDKSCLDVGCNSGIFTLDLVLCFNILHIKGLDIDKSLIKKAKANLEKFQAQLTSEPNQHPEGEENSDSGPSIESNFLTNDEPTKTVLPTPKNLKAIVLFHSGDYLNYRDKQKYDVITCMSVVKWIHINQGDAGLIQLFQRFYSDLNDNGILILEPQPWSSYNYKKLSKPAKANLETRRPQVSVGGFSCRDILIFRKEAKDPNQLFR